MPYKDPAKQKEAQHKHYLKNKKLFRERFKKTRSIRAEWFREYKKENKGDIKVYNHDYNLEHHNEIQKRQTNYQRERKKIDPGRPPQRQEKKKIRETPKHFNNPFAEALKKK